MHEMRDVWRAIQYVLSQKSLWFLPQVTRRMNVNDFGAKVKFRAHKSRLKAGSLKPIYPNTATVCLKFQSGLNPKKTLSKQQ